MSNISCPKRCLYLPKPLLMLAQSNRESFPFFTFACLDYVIMAVFLHLPKFAVLLLNARLKVGHILYVYTRPKFPDLLPYVWAHFLGSEIFVFDCTGPPPPTSGHWASPNNANRTEKWVIFNCLPSLSKVCSDIKSKALSPVWFLTIMGK